MSCAPRLAASSTKASAFVTEAARSASTGDACAIATRSVLSFSEARLNLPGKGLRPRLLSPFHNNQHYVRFSTTTVYDQKKRLFSGYDGKLYL
jgi:hypothetical protein